MTRPAFVLVAPLALGLVGCSEGRTSAATPAPAGGEAADDDPCKPLVQPATSPLILCPDSPAVSANLLLQNPGCGPLEISTLEFQGDDRDAFTSPELRPAADATAAGGSATVAFSYRPPDDGEDHVLLVISSNADNFEELLVPVCGRGLAADGSPQPCLEDCRDSL